MPRDARKAAVVAQQVARAKLITFKQCAEEFHTTNQTRWGNQKHRDEWISAMRRFAYPILGNLSVDAIDSGHVCDAVAPVLTAGKHVTAARLRGRIEVVLDYAIAKGRRTAANPATKDVICHILPLPAEKDGVTHQPAVPLKQLPTLMRTLRTTHGKHARLLEMVALSVMRIEAVRQARLDEFDLDERVWTIPKGKPGMKRFGRDHRVPLTDRMVEIVRDLQAQSEGPFVFGGRHAIRVEPARELLAKLLKSMGYDHAVPHGLRAALKSWATATRSYPTEVVELVLAHTIKSQVAAAYQRDDLLDKWRILMADWERHCYGAGPASGEIIKLRA
jgi:integrase